MESIRIILLILFVVSFVSIRIFISVYIKYKKDGIKGVKKYFKEFIISGLCIILILTIYYSLPRHEVGIDIIINNNNLNAEIYINGDFYNIDKNEIININKQSGHITIKTENSNKIIYYENDKSIFKNNRKININLNSNDIKISSFNIKLNTTIENHKNFDAIIEIINKRR